MVQGSDIIIIGGGIIGCAIAHSLQRHDVSIRIIDNGPVAQSASHAAAGMLAPTGEFGGQLSALSEFALASLCAWPAFVDHLESATGLKLDFRQHGSIELLTKSDASISPPSKHEGRIFLDHETLHDRLPHLSRHAYAGWFDHHDAQIDPRRTLEALRINLSHHGNICWVNAHAARIGHNKGLLSVVETSDGQSFGAQRIIIASGIGLKALKTDFVCPPIIPVKGEAVCVDLTLERNHPVLRSPDIYLCPKDQGRLVIGATEFPDNESTTIDAMNIAHLKNAAAHIMPAIAQARETERWMGIRPGTPDGAPFIGHSQKAPENIIFAVGHYRNGVLFAPQTAKLIAHLIMDNDAGQIPEAFSPDRVLRVSY